ncbi:regulation of nuclear pre-mRNA domain-containing protein 1B [Tanacetum coccineum]
MTRIALSHWCIFHRSKAEVVVTTWEKQFHSSEVAQKVPLLYLANDILQNSKRKGNEFVSEFWKVLPGALKVLIDKGDDHGKNVVSRLKLTIGSTAERIVSAFHLVVSEHHGEDEEMNKCKSAVHRVKKNGER